MPTRAEQPGLSHPGACARARVGFILWYCDACRTYFLRPSHWVRNDAHRAGDFGKLCTHPACPATDEVVLAAFALGGKPAVEAMGIVVD